MQVSHDEELLSHEAIFSRYRGRWSHELYPYSRGDIRNQQSVVVMATMLESGFKAAELQAAADSAPQPQAGENVLGSMRMGASPNG